MGAVARIPDTKCSDAFMVKHETEMLVSPSVYGDEPSTLVGAEFQAGVGGDNCARSCAVVYRGEWDKERALHRLGTPLVVKEPTGHAEVSTSSSAGSAQ